VARRIEQLDEGGVLVLNFGKGFRPNERGVCQATLDVELRLNGLITNDKFCMTHWGHMVPKGDQQRQSNGRQEGRN
jgi:hypothetical protein